MPGVLNRLAARSLPASPDLQYRYRGVNVASLCQQIGQPLGGVSVVGVGRARMHSCGSVGSAFPRRSSTP